MVINNKKYTLKKKYKIILYVLIILIILLSCGLYINYRLSNEYAFKQLGYSKKQVEYLVTIDDDLQEKLLAMKYDPDLISLVKQKYFIKANFNKYLDYMKLNSKKSIKDVVSLVNVGRYREFYENPKKTDTLKKELMLVNKYNYLTEDYEPEEIVDVSTQYAYEGRIASKKSYEAYKKMADAAKAEGVNMIINSAYRSYQSQKAVYDETANNYGEDYADDFAAHPGFSEHQSGYAFDIGKYNVLLDDFEKTDVFKWLSKNAYKYGFILRYPKGKEEITGFTYESWHYRYVGEEAAKQIYEEKITFDEYYAYYVDNK